jgi:hypothetical protein
MYNNFVMGFGSIFLFTSQVDWQVLLVVYFNVLSPILPNKILSNILDYSTLIYFTLFYFWLLHLSLFLVILGYKL